MHLPMSCLFPRSLHLAPTWSLIIVIFPFVSREDASYTHLRSVSTPGSVRVRVRIRVRVKVKVRVRVRVRVSVRVMISVSVRYVPFC